MNLNKFWYNFQTNCDIIFNHNIFEIKYFSVFDCVKIAKVQNLGVLKIVIRVNENEIKIPAVATVKMTLVLNIYIFCIIRINWLLELNYVSGIRILQTSFHLKNKKCIIFTMLNFIFPAKFYVLNCFLNEICY